MVLELIQKFGDSIRRVETVSELTPVLGQIAQAYGADGAILVDFARDHSAIKTILDTNPPRQLAARAIIETYGIGASLESLRRVMERGPVLRITARDLPSGHAYKRFWIDLWFSEALLVPVCEHNDIAGLLCLTGRSNSDKLRDVAVSHLAYSLICQLRQMETETVERGGLSRRELEVLRMSSDGLTSKEIAQRLGISMRTVNAHVDHAITKLGARNRMGAVVELARRGLLAIGSERRAG